MLKYGGVMELNTEMLKFLINCHFQRLGNDQCQLPDQVVF